MTLWLISLKIWQSATAFLFHYASITYAADFVGYLTKLDKDDFFLPLQPKSGFLPEAGRGRPKLLRVIEDGAKEAGQPVFRPLSRPSPTANLAGIWKGEPLSREVRGDQVHPNAKINCGVPCLLHERRGEKYVGCNLYWFGFGSFHGPFAGDRRPLGNSGKILQKFPSSDSFARRVTFVSSSPC